MNDSPPATNEVTFRDRVDSAIRFWETGRLVFNAVLGFEVLAFLLLSWPTFFDFNLLFLAIQLAVLAVLANVCYCSAYLVDIFVQYSSFRDQWLKARWVLFSIGMVFSCLLAYFACLILMMPM